MTKKEYNTLLGQHGAAELANNFVFPVRVSGKQKNESGSELKKVLATRRSEMSDKDKLEATLLQLRYQMEEYLNDTRFDKNKTFGFFLKNYIAGLRLKRNEFANEINIKPTELSQYINNHRTPPKNIIVRLELHSGNTIPAVNWYRLCEKKILHELSSNKALRNSQKKYVKKVAEPV
ncbi:hypothetical protein BH10BAC3_BH10BAC3_42160 [soil metagenome]